MIRITLFLFALVYSIFAFSDELEGRIQLLDEALQKQDYEKILTTLYPQLIHKETQLSESDSIQDLQWLSSKTELGHVPLYYFLSWKLIKSDIPESRRLNARGRIGLMLDANECNRAPKYSPLYIVLEGRVIESNMPLRDDHAAWALAVNEALLWYKAHPETPSAAWHCSINNMLSPEAAKTARAMAWQKIKASNDADLPHN